MTSETNTNPVERIYPDDTRVKPQTIAHHMARYQFANKYIKNKAKVLDLGCGTGYGSQMMRDMGHTVTGLDISNEAIEYAQEKYPEGTYKLVDMTQWKPDSSYDAVTFFEVIEHLPFEEGIRIIKEVYDSLEVGGIFILSTPRDINEQRNGWHQSRWDNVIIHEELSKLFPHVEIYGQDWDTAEIRTENVENEDFYIGLAKKA